MENESNKKHYKRKSGPKAKKKKAKREGAQSKGPHKGNPKAFAIRSVQKTQRMVHRALDLKVKQHRLPLPDRSNPDNLPPTIIAVVGPPKVGKTTLMKALIRYYTHQNCNQPVGPITFVVNKTRRVTLIEANNDLNSLIDVAKIADIVLLLIDASFGFEMETFEFMNICQNFGMPRIVGVLTHLDSFPDCKRLRKRKKLLKHRFWTEVHQGAKMFYLTRFINFHYSRTEIQKMARALSVMSFRPMDFHLSHSYIVSDRIEDITDPQIISQSDGRCDRKVAFFGYVRGGGNQLRDGSSIHIAGCGDFVLSSVKLLKDPCPLPGSAKGRVLMNSERTIYAPMAGLGGLLYDSDAIYFENVNSGKENTDPLISCLTNANSKFDLDMNESRNEFISGVSLDDYATEDSDETVSDYANSEFDGNVDSVERPLDLTNKLDSWKMNTINGVVSWQKEHVNWNLYVYEDKPFDGMDDDFLKKTVDTGEDFCSVRNSPFLNEREDNWEQLPDEPLANCFVTGKWGIAEDAKRMIEADDTLCGDFEDLEENNDSGEVKTELGEESGINDPMKGESKADRDERIRKVFTSKSNRVTDNDKYLQSLKEDVERQATLNRDAFEKMDNDERVLYEGFRPGFYVRIEVDNIPCEFVKYFDPTYPVLMGVVLPIEEQMSYLQIRLKCHRWYNKFLKTMDPLIFSIGWRRFQSQPVFAIQDHNMRLRSIKYTPKNLHCIATIYGPVTTHGTGVIGVQTLEPNERIGFRIAATGTVINCDKSYQIVKKLKLIGYPFQIYQKTAFIKDMFHSELEVAKFEGASIRTVSGIRGIVKKAVKSPEGAFRATFEDKILQSDIVFMRTWHSLTLPQFFNSVRSNLLSPEERSKWKGMRTVGELRFLAGDTERKYTDDSVYKPIERKEKYFPPLKIPKKLQAQLPFDDKPKIIRKPKDPVQSGRVAVVLDEKEKKAANAIDMLKALYKEKFEAKQIKLAAYHKKIEQENKTNEIKHTQKMKKLKKDFFKTLKYVKGKKMSAK